MVTDEQVRRLKSFMNKYDNQGIAAAKAGMAEKTGRKYLKAELLPSQMKKWGCCGKIVLGFGRKYALLNQQMYHNLTKNL